jgi:hypothetical protein
VWNFYDDVLAVFHLEAKCLVVVAFADLLDRYTLVSSDGFAGRLLKTGDVKTSVSGFPLLTLIP